MSDLTTIPVQDWFETQLSQEWNGATGTIYVVSTPSYTPTNTPTYIVVNPGKTTMQIAKVTGYSAVNKTLTVSSISQEKGLGIANTQQTHSTGSKVIISDNYQFWEDIQTAIASKLDIGWGNATTYATTAARDSALGGDGAATLPYTDIYVTWTGLFYNYNLSSNAWETQDTGTPTANASATAAWKVEIATSAQSIAGTDTGETGALLSVLPSDIKTNLFTATQGQASVYGLDAGWDDTYVVALTPVLAGYTAGQKLSFKSSTGNTWACTVNFWPGVLNIKTKDWNDPQTGVIRANTVVTGAYDWTNFVLDTEDFATTANKGIVEMATDAEVVTGTDETRYVNSKQVKVDYFNTTSTKDAADSSTTQTFAHGLPRIPKRVKVTAVYVTWAADTVQRRSETVYNWSTQSSLSFLSTATWGWNTIISTSFRLNVSASWDSAYSTWVITVDATNINIAWTKTGSPTGVYTLLVEANT